MLLYSDTNHCISIRIDIVLRCTLRITACLMSRSSNGRTTSTSQEGVDATEVRLLGDSHKRRTMTNGIVFDRKLGFQAKSRSDEIDKFEAVLGGSKRVLLKTSSIFPFDLFPDEITIDETKVSIVYHEFFFSDEVHSITIDMIKDIDVETGPLFATLKIVPDGYPGRPMELRFLKKKDAIKARQIIQGLIIARKHGIDPTKIQSEDFLEKIELMGTTNTDD